ncbi:hypothetical protein [Jiangella alkaliphila]|uniref:Uncharacterized protein n=1 Tax=Jiangella alkaliphila TaxID=419479 RepID=A0A1H2IU79_9ACTN|nr:hypothetical protein [Jiangella alkaliphila]SDU47717.1 hypothetical protein SAMN04488563_2019 [Jiangella alkaliphila]
MTGVESRNAGCPVKWCDETGTHAVHRKYLASVPGAIRGAGLVGVNLAQRKQPRASVCVELTVTTPWASTAGHLFAAASVPEIAAALTEAAERATELDAARHRNGE